MGSVVKLMHRSRQIAAKSLRLGRRVVQDLRQPSDIETLIDSLPEIETAPAGLKDKVVLITGGTQGVGLVVARAFGERGAKIVINGRRPDAVETALANLTKAGISVAGITADAATAEGAQTVVDAAAQTFGTLDILINNAAVAGPMEPALAVDANELDDAVRINLTGPMHCTRVATAYFLSQAKQGRVINLSSIATEGDYARMWPYSTTKAAIESFTRFAAIDLPQAEVVVTAMILPSVRTERKAQADWASAELLPPADILVPAFEYCATGPANQLHGRTLSAGRFITDTAAESRIAGVASVRQQLLYPELEIDGQQVDRDPAKMVLLDRAENQHGMSPKALVAISDSLTDHPPAFYPDERFKRLRSALAREHGLTPDHFALGPGSWELIARTLQLFVKPGEQVVSSGPGWFGFNLTCTRNGVAPTMVPFDRGETGNRPSHNLDQMLAAITPRTRMVYLISPSNPEGVTLQHAETVEFLQNLPPELPVMIDEAYAEFADDPNMVDVARLIRESDRSVIGLRTFSKFYAMAGMRVGYAMARPELADLIRRSEQIFSISHMAEVAAVAALEDQDHRISVFTSAKDARTKMHRGLTELGLGHISSQAPFVFADAPPDFDGMISELGKDGIVVPPYTFGDGKSVMLPVGKPDQIDRILDAIRTRM